MPANMLRKEPAPLPEVSEIEVVRHYTHLSQRNFGVDTGFYPLGSCTMKYNPKLNEDMAVLPGFAHIHPLQPDSTVQGAIQLIYELEQYLAEISGMTRVTLQPSAGAHGELTGLMLIKAYHREPGPGTSQPRAYTRQRARHQSRQCHAGRLQGGRGQDRPPNGRHRHGASCRQLLESNASQHRRDHDDQSQYAWPL